MMCQRSGRPPMSIIGLGRDTVSSVIRLPTPPARITAFTALRTSRSGGRQELLGHRGKVPVDVLGDDQALAYDAHRDSLDRHHLARRRDAAELNGMRPRDGPVREDLVPRRKLLVDLESDVRERVEIRTRR